MFFGNSCDNNSTIFNTNNNSYIDHKIFYYTGTRLTDSNIADGANVSNSSILENDTIETNMNIRFIKKIVKLFLFIMKILLFTLIYIPVVV